jgi:hypothetical protein
VRALSDLPLEISLRYGLGTSRSPDPCCRHHPPSDQATLGSRRFDATCTRSASSNLLCSSTESIGSLIDRLRRAACEEGPDAGSPFGARPTTRTARRRQCPAMRPFWPPQLPTLALPHLRGYRNGGKTSNTLRSELCRARASTAGSLALMRLGRWGAVDWPRSAKPRPAPLVMEFSRCPRAHRRAGASAECPRSDG